MVTVTAHATGWHIHATGTGSPHPFTADLGACPYPDGHKSQLKLASCPTGYHRSHVERIVTVVSKTYDRKATVPEVPPLPI